MMAALLVIAVLLGQSAPAQSGDGGLSIRGTVADQWKALIPGATIEIRSDPNKPPEKIVTDERGVYVLRGLVPGVYEISTVLPGFERNFQGVDLKAPANVDFVVRLQNVETCACISSSAQPPAPLPMPKDTLRRAKVEQMALRFWQEAIQAKGGNNPQQIDLPQPLLNDLRSLGSDIVPALAPLLQDVNPGVRHSTVLMLGALGPDAREALPYLWPMQGGHGRTAFAQSVDKAIESIGRR